MNHTTATKRVATIVKGDGCLKLTDPEGNVLCRSFKYGPYAQQQMESWAKMNDVQIIEPCAHGVTNPNCTHYSD